MYENYTYLARILHSSFIFRFGHLERIGLMNLKTWL